MDYEKMLLLSMIFVFSVFLFPDFVAAVNAVSISEALRPLIIYIPHIWLASLVVLGLFGG